MIKKSARNNELLSISKDNTSPQVYSMLLDLVNEGRQDLAESVIKIDYLIQYANTCVRQKDFEEARATLDKAKIRLDKVKGQGADISYINYLFEGVVKKLK
jgi:hypothetical protein